MLDYDKEIKKFIKILIKRTRKSQLAWNYLVSYLESQELLKSKQDLELQQDSELRQIIYCDSTDKFFENDSFYLEKKGSFIFLVHIQQTSQLDNKSYDNYILYGKVCDGGNLMHISGLSDMSYIAKYNNKRIKKLCKIVKQNYQKWLATDGGYNGPMSSLIRNIISD